MPPRSDGFTVSSVQLTTVRFFHGNSESVTDAVTTVADTLKVCRDHDGYASVALGYGEYGRDPVCLGTGLLGADQESVGIDLGPLGNGIRQGNQGVGRDASLFLLSRRGVGKEAVSV